MNTAQHILHRAADLIQQRAEQRDQANGEKSMAKTVQAFNAIYDTELTEVQGWHFMELLKMVRSAYGVYTPDDFNDKVAYAALAAEAAVPVTQLTHFKDYAVAFERGMQKPCCDCYHTDNSVGTCDLDAPLETCSKDTGWVRFCAR